MARSARDLPGRLRGARPRRLLGRSPTCCGSRPTCCASAATARVYDLVAALHPRRAAAHDLQLPPAADRRQPVPGQRHLLPDRPSRAALGRAFRHGRHRAAGRRARRPDRGAGRARALRRRRRPDPRRRTARATGVDARRTASRSPPTSWSPTPIPPAPTATPAREQRRRWSRGEAQARPLLDGPVRLVLRHEPAVSRTSPTTPSCWGRATASCSTTSSTGRCWPTDFSLYLHRPTATDPLPGAAGLRRLLRALAGAEPRRRPGLGGAGRALPAGASTGILEATVMPGLSDVDRHLAGDDAAGFPRRLPELPRLRLRPRAGADAIGVVPAAQRRRGRARTSTSSAPAPIRAPACPASSPRPGSSIRVVPDAVSSR